MPIYSPEAFVYCWTNLDNGNKYIGYHKGSPDDGYICSSKSDRFWEDWQLCRWSRQIIAEGSVEDCIRLELKILQNVDIYSDEYYNNSIGQSIIWTDEIRKKSSLSKTGKKRSQETCKKISKAHKGRIHSEEARSNMGKHWKGKSFSNEHKEKISKSLRGKKRNHFSDSHRENLSKALHGRVMSDETRKKMSESRRGKKRGPYKKKST